MTLRLLFLAFVLTCFTQNQVTAQTITGAAALTALDEMQGAMEQTINDAENAGNNILNNGAFQALTLIQNFKVTYKDVLKSTTEALDQTAYNIFLNLRITTDKILAGAMDFMDELNVNIMSLNAVMAQIPGIKGKPLISKVNIPVFIKNDSVVDEYEIRFSGSRLDLKSKMKVNGYKVRPSEMSTQSLVYHIEKGPLKAALEGKRVHLKLKIRYGWWGIKAAKFNYFAKVVPKDFATVKVTYSTANFDTVKIKRVETMPATRTGASNWRGKRKTNKETFVINVSDPLHIIDVSSVKLKTTTDRYGYGASIKNKSQAAILIQQHARSDNEPYGGGGKVQSQVSFTELKITKTMGTQTIGNLPLEFNDPISIKLAGNAAAVQSIQLRLYNGKMINLTIPNTNRNFEVDFRPVDKVLTIKNVRLQ